MTVNWQPLQSSRSRLELVLNQYSHDGAPTNLSPRAQRGTHCNGTFQAPVNHETDAVRKVTMKSSYFFFISDAQKRTSTQEKSQVCTQAYLLVFFSFKSTIIHQIMCSASDEGF